MDLNAIRAIANAVLYEGYMLYPYRPSALKNRSQGWSFGTLVPEAYAASHAGEAFAFRAELPVTGGGADVQFSGEVRFLQLAGKSDSAVWSDAIERSVALPAIVLADLLAAPVDVAFAFEAAGEQPCYPVRGTASVLAEAIADTAIKISLSVRNESTPALDWNTREHALTQALVSAHAVVIVSGGEFVSLLDPPEELCAVAENCRQQGVFPVLTGEEGEHAAMLVSPIILYDYPKIAEQSHGDFFDGGEIDELLTLRVLTLTADEKRQVRAAGDRARRLLQRTEALTPEEIIKLHGVTRGLPRKE